MSLIFTTSFNLSSIQDISEAQNRVYIEHQTHVFNFNFRY